MSGVGHLGEEAETSLRAGRQGQEGDEGAQTQTVTDVILGTGTESRGQWQELGFNKSPCVSTLIGQEKLQWSSNPSLPRETAACLYFSLILKLLCIPPVLP